MNNSIKAAAKTMAAVIAAGAMAVAPVAGTINFGAMNVMAATQATVSIGGLNAGDSVTLYKIVETSTDDSNQWNGWKTVDNAKSEVSIEQSGKNLKVDVGGLMGLINAGSITATGNATSVTESEFTSGNLDPGVYVAVITPGTTSNGTEQLRIYNPVFLSVSYDGTNATTGSITDIKEAKFETNKITNTDTTTALSNKAYAKSSTTSLEKTIVNKDEDGVTDTTQNGVKAEDLQKGDTSDFKITTTFPDYRGFTNLTDITFKIDDNQDAQFGKPTNIQVFLGDSTTALTSGFSIKYGSFTDNNYSGTLDKSAPDTDEDEDFTITFDTATLLANPATAVTITYSSVLVNPTVYNGTNDNNVKLTYTNSNQATPTVNTKTDKTTDYSFKINVKKVDSTDETKVLQDAEFKIERQTLTNDKLVAYTPNDGDHVAFANATAKTDNTGLVSFSGLDEGYYKISETKAPDKDAAGNSVSYSQNTEAFYIHVKPTWDGNHASITGYTIEYVTDDGKTTKTQSSGHLDRAENEGEYTLTVKDTPVNGLPSTGARSALILTIAGIAVMVTVMAASRRRKISE